MTHTDLARRMVDAANGWLDSLDDRQRSAALNPWPSDEERHRWYYTPTDHGGLPLRHMRPAQQRLAMQLVLVGRVEASSPAFLGADPAQSPLLGGHLLRPLGAAEDLARDLVHSLDDRQAAQARISPVAPVDIVSGNRPRVSDGAGFRTEHHEAVALTQAPKGIAAVDLTDDQQDQLRAVLSVFLGRIPDELAEREARKFAGNQLNGVHFAWAGGTERGDPHYYRLHGPRLLAEYDNTQRNVNHIHTVWRDPDGDFGDDVLAQHRATFHRNS